ncbi:Pfs, NACHT and ankyrin domain protein [Cryphonectria parasitica EP155]|uniref:Pfs, NACHT and ankyrin domain protein n=1 Tax=Cryphonectria parasitica (strain ATCC 38755 / EP155) TaxID=660469 RepID=A0A9P5CPQ3_CRYP1|nr:Pfs, NACHT and ankyrin domain protein [Cryphonectria parasitica EP155]KAF3765426.1 Pfs, NACHT and ankyrin domain protein [Cryphonectria parasitica EP155]
MTCSKNRDDYTVGWVAALSIERAAAIAMLEEKHDKPLDFSNPTSDPNTYAWGRIAEHNIVIASLPAGVYGTTSAATTATNMLSSFPNVRVGLMVGIGAGIPDLDIRLGDVVVSQPSGTGGGGFLNAPPQALLTALGALQAAHEMQPSRVPEFLGEMLERYPQMAKGTATKPSYAFPGRLHDRLFAPTYKHAAGRRSCQQCDPAQEIPREEREESDPVIHYGLIASGNTLVKDAEARDALLAELGDECMCLEMEAAGLMNSFPCIIVRGISDYADSHKNDRWQRYAAAAAAAFAKEFLSCVPASDVQNTPSAVKILQDINQKMGEIHHDTKAGFDSMHLQKRQEKLDAWLSAIDHSTNQQRARDTRQEGSGQWFLQGEHFSTWQTEPASFLWLHGIPGCGKTVLSSAIVDHLQQTPSDGDSDILLLYFYFDFTDSRKESLDNAVRSLISQLYYKEPQSQKHLDLLWSQKGREQPSTQELSSTFEKMLEDAGEVWVILDALDECKTRDGSPAPGLLKWLENLHLRHKSLHLLVTSRPENDIKSAIESFAKKEWVLCLESHLVAKDIHNFIHERVTKHDDLKRWRKRPEVQQEIERVLQAKSDGMFRWVACQLQILKDCTDYFLLKKALSSLPETLSATYARILESIPEMHLPSTARILHFLILSDRALRLDEAVDAIAVQPSERPRFNPINRMPDPLEISRYCSSLVILTTRDTGEEEIVEMQLAHFSVKEFFLSKPPNLLKPGINKYFGDRAARITFAETCLSYLRELNETDSIYTILESRPFALYCSEYWSRHAAMVEDEESVASLVQAFFTDPGFYTTCYQLFNPDWPWKALPGKSDVEAGGLYYASQGGFKQAVTTLLNRGADVNVQGGNHSNALTAASAKGHEQIVQMLLDKGADDLNSALQAALLRGYEQIVQMLLDKGADDLNSTLQAAAIRGYEQIVQMLLDKGANVNIQNGNHGSALQIAARGGYEQIIVQMLLDKGADVNIQSKYYGSALQAAAIEGYEQIVQMLLDKGADMNIQSKYYSSALQAAIIEEYKQII